MKIIIIGAGKVGELLCHDLSSEGNDITLIEKNEKVLETILSNNDIMGFVGNATSYDVQMEADVPNADFFISVTEKDEINIISSVIAKKIGAKFTIARVRNPEYSKQIDFMKESLGIDLIINPELEAAKYIKQNIDFPGALNVENFLDGKLKLIEFLISENSKLDGISILDFNRKLFPNLLVCIIKRDDDIIIPSGNDIFKVNDRIYITGLYKDILYFQNYISVKSQKINSAFIVGASITTHYLAKELLNEKIKVKILEIDENKAREISEDLTEAIVINGDANNEDTLSEENFKNYDSCICMTGMDETNVFLSLFAKKIGIRKIITKINKLAFINILGENSFQSIVTPKKLAADSIVRIVRSIANKKGSKIENLYRLENNRVEAIELLINSENEFIGIPLKDLKIKKNTLFAYIIRNNVAIFPRGSDCIKIGDRLIIISTEKFIEDLSDVIQE